MIFNALILFLATAIGSALILFWKRPFSYRVALSFSGGVMLVASFLSLIVPAIESGGFLLAATGIFLGFVFLGILENLFPHEHILKGYEGIFSLHTIKKLYLITIGVVIHNIPEGLSVGIATAHSKDLGFDLAIAMGVQDIPEGLIVSLTLYSMKMSLAVPIIVGVLSGLVESLSALFGYIAFELVKDLISLGLGFGGGAMIYVTVKEVFPEIYTQSNNHLKITLGFLLGFMLMLFLETM